jgi:hypothetical protein
MIVEQATAYTLRGLSTLIYKPRGFSIYGVLRA